jgi:hypothetical protein
MPRYHNLLFAVEVGCKRRSADKNLRIHLPRRPVSGRNRADVTVDGDINAFVFRKIRFAPAYKLTAIILGD